MFPAEWKITSLINQTWDEWISIAPPCKRSADVSLQHDNILHSKGFSNTICTHDYCCIYPNNSCSWCFYKGEINDNALVSYQMKAPSIILYECSHMLIPLRNSLVNKTKAVASTVRGWCMQGLSNTSFKFKITVHCIIFVHIWFSFYPTVQAKRSDINLTVVWFFIFIFMNFFFRWQSLQNFQCTLIGKIDYVCKASDMIIQRIKPSVLSSIKTNVQCCLN